MTPAERLLRAIFGDDIRVDLKPSFSSYGDIKVMLELVHPLATVDMLGFLPTWLDPADPRGAVDQFDEHYKRYGGWHDVPGWELRADRLSYPGDPDRPLIAKMRLRDETVMFFQGAWTAVVQPDGSYRVARLD